MADEHTPQHPEPPISDDDTDELDPAVLARHHASQRTEVNLAVEADTFYDYDEEAASDDEDVPFKLPRHAQPTLPGTFGLDPNPDRPSRNSEPTVRQAAVRAQPTVPMPPQGGAYPQQQAPQAYGPPRQGAYVPPPPQQGPRPLKRPRQRRIFGLRPGCLWMLMGLMVTFCGGITLITGAAAAIFVPQIEAQWTGQLDQVDAYAAFQSTFILDRYGNELFEAFGEGRRESVPYERFPSELILATLAIEDDSFFSNPGIDVAATTVAFLQFIGASPDENTPGGSTITQQLVRNVLFDLEKRAERSVQRKAEEIILALLLTQRRSKEDILELYLNEIYYGNLAYGAQAAAQTFFAKDVQNLSLGEAALLAGLPQAPASLDPLNPDPEVQNAVMRRWRQVLGEMVEEGFISAGERDQVLREGLRFVTPETSLKAPHFTVYAQGELERLMRELGYSPDEIANGGWRVYTTLDQEVNNIALGAARTQVAGLQRNNVSNAAVVVLKPLTGEIIGMVGSIDYDRDDIDGRVNVTTAFRQPGSTMKPFTYAAAIERGMTPGDVIWDTRTEIGIPGQPTYVPRNYDGTFHGPMTMRYALANSYNIPAVQTLRLVGVADLLSLMHRFGVSTLQGDPSQYGLSLTLGGGEVSLLELANAYSVFANQGSYVPPTSILCIIDSDDNIVYQYENSCIEGRITNQTVSRSGFGRQVLDPRIAFIISDMLSDNPARTPAMGSNSALNLQGIDAAVKTGTTNDVKDNWTIGYTRNVTVGVWVGNNDGDPMVNSSGLTGAAPIWNATLRALYETPGRLNPFAVGGQLLPDQAGPPAGLSLREICDVRSVRDPATNCPRTINEWFLDGPAGIPDEQGNLNYPQVPPSRPPDSSTLQQISPGVYRALVYELPPQVANAVQFNVGPGDKQPLPPKYCRVTPDLVGQAQSAGARDLVFIAGPATSQSDAVEAERYARQANFAFLPTIDCWPEAFVAPQWGPAITTAVITSPQNGAVLTNAVPIIGTVQFTPDQADFYHLYIQGGQFPDWTALGTMHRESVTSGVLEELYVPALQSGTYRLRLALVKGGDFVQTPYEISFTVP